MPSFSLSLERLYASEVKSERILCECDRAVSLQTQQLEQAAEPPSKKGKPQHGLFRPDESDLRRMPCLSPRSPLSPLYKLLAINDKPRSRSVARIVRYKSTTASSSTTTNNRTRGNRIPYPYPAHPNPTPHQIFHLPSNASQDAIKARYYELVKIYHPDSSTSRVLSAAASIEGSSSRGSSGQAKEMAEARFQAITKAYDILRKGKSKARNLHGVAQDVRDSMGVMSDRRKRELRNRAELNVEWLDERWKERLMVGVLFVSVVGFVYQTVDTRRQGIAAVLDRRGSRQRGDRHVDPRIRPVEGRSEATIHDEESLALSDEVDQRS